MGGGGGVTGTFGKIVGIGAIGAIGRFGGNGGVGGDCLFFLIMKTPTISKTKTPAATKSQIIKPLGAELVGTTGVDDSVFKAGEKLVESLERVLPPLVKTASALSARASV